MNEDGEIAGATFRASGLRVQSRGGRLVVRSGPPAFIQAFVIAAMPAAVLVSMLLRSRRWEPEGAPALFASLAFALIAWAAGGGWTLTLDRRGGLAKLRRGPWRTRRPLAAFVGVRFSSMLQSQIEQVRRRQTVMPYAPVADIGCGVALVDASGAWLRVTRSQDRGFTPRREDAERVARLVADYLGLPFLAPYETPPGGAVPPPLEEATVQRGG